VLNPALLKPMQFVLQVGANMGETLTFEMPVISSLTLNLTGLDYVKNPLDGLNRVNSAISTVTGARTTLGSVSNRLEHTFSANNQLYESLVSSYSRIRDLDIARSVSSLARQQILVSSTGAMLAQANTMRQNVKWLLNGMGGGSQRLGLSGTG
jgi:flagellin